MVQIKALALSLVALFFVTTSTLAAELWETRPEPPAMPAAVSSGYAAVDGIQMYYATYGAGEPILLIHGGLGHADIWSNQVIEMAKTNLVIVADSRGHGRSSRNEQPYGYELMASDYLALLDFLNIDKVDLVGWSDGGIIGIAIALKHPERLKKVYAQAANVTVDGVNPEVMNNKVFAGYIDRMGQDYVKMSKTPDQYAAFVEQISKMWATEPAWTKEQLATIAVPIAIVQGDHDEAILMKHTEYMASAIPGAKLIVLKDSSHFAMLQDPAGYTKSAMDFFAGN
jgi:pimeloyl-ACP methyl ester carboxylesterase